ncbi:hypothetical protein SCANM124S_00462 [Streptomyces canus]
MNGRSDVTAPVDGDIGQELVAALSRQGSRVGADTVGDRPLPGQRRETAAAAMERQASIRRHQRRCPAQADGAFRVPGWWRSRICGCAWRQRANLAMAAGVTGVKKLTRLPSGSRNSSDRLPQGIVVGPVTKSVTKPVRFW